jgi:hypothetical protein
MERPKVVANWITPLVLPLERVNLLILVEIEPPKEERPIPLDFYCVTHVPSLLEPAGILEKRGNLGIWAKFQDFCNDNRISLSP